MKNRTKNNYSIKEADPVKKRTRTVNNDPECLYSYRSIPISEAMVERMIEDLNDWPIKNPDEISVTEFYLSRGIARSTYYDLLKRHPRLKETHDNTMRRMGERLLKRSINKEAVWQPVQFMLYSYAPEFKEATEYHQQLGQKQLESTNFKIQMIEVPNSPLVPIKKESENE